MENNQTTIVYLIGMGPGNVDCLTKEAEQALSQATVCIGAPRMCQILEQLKTAGGICKKDQIVYDAYKEDEVVALLEKHAGETVAVIFSGDIGFYSGAKKLSLVLRSASRKDPNMSQDMTGTTEQINAGEISYELHYIPGLSSIPYLFDKIGQTWEDAEMVSNHGIIANIPAKVLHHAKVGTLLGGEDQVAEICTRLTEVGLGDIGVIVGERLSYEDEKITMKYAKGLCEKNFDKLTTAIFLNDHPELRYVSPGIPDGAFIRGNVPMTKEEVRTVVISKLGIYQGIGRKKYDPNSGQFRVDNLGAVVYDVGAGTGSVSIEMALLMEQGSVYAIEKNPEAVELLYANRAKFHAGNMEIVAGEATQVIPSLPAPTHVFIGGSSGNLLEIVNMIYAKNPNACIVVTAVTMETQNELLTISEVVKKQGKTFNMVQLAVTRSREVGAYHMLQAENPVWIASFW